MLPGKYGSILAGLLLGLWLGLASAHAAPKKSSPNLNLIDESVRLKVLQEESVQKDIPSARRTYTLGFSDTSAKKLEVISNGRTVNYDDVRRPGVSGGIGYFPLRYRGYFGVLGNVTYSYGERSGLVKTSLHWITGDIALAYRYEESTSAWIKPFIALGAGYNVLVQRGPSYYNTSEARGVGTGTLGANFNLNRTLNFNSPLTWELTARVRKVIDNADSSLDFNGEHYALGLELAL